MKRSPLSIGIVTVANLPEGTGRTGRLRTLAGALVGLGHKVRIWNQHSIERTGKQEVSGVLGGAQFEYVLGTTERYWGFRSLPLKLRAVARIRKRICAAAVARDLDLVLFNHLAFYDTFPLTRAAQRFGCKTIQCYEDERREIVGKVNTAQKVFGWNSRLADRYCPRLADQIWAISTYLQQKYSRLSGHPERVCIVPTIIDCHVWPVLPEPDNGPPRLLYSGSFAEQDDIEKLTLALAALKREGVDFRMRFIGANPTDQRVRWLKSVINQYQMDHLIEVVGFVPTAQVRKEIAEANILLNLRTDSIWSHSGLSTKLSEYLASGRTVMTTNVGDNARYVVDGESALVVDPKASAETVASVLKRAIQDRVLRQKLGVGARKAALEHFDAPVVQRRIADYLEELFPTI